MICSALLVLSLNAYHESRGEPFQGQVAVSQVVLRRAGYRPERVCKVVYRLRQFSWTATRPPVHDRAAWAKAVRAAQIALLWAHGAPSRDYSAGADHYHARHVAPAWARRMQRVAVIGEHKFYQGTVNRMRSPVTRHSAVRKGASFRDVASASSTERRKTCFLLEKLFPCSWSLRSHHLC